jgi:hypothetical protein
MEERTQMCPDEWERENRYAPLNGRKNTDVPRRMEDRTQIEGEIICN